MSLRPTEPIIIAQPAPWPSLSIYWEPHPGGDVPVYAFEPEQRVEPAFIRELVVGAMRRREFSRKRARLIRRWLHDAAVIPPRQGRINKVVLVDRFDRIVKVTA